MEVFAVIKWMGGYYHDKDNESSWAAYPNQCSGYYVVLKTKTILFNPLGGKVVEITPFTANFLLVEKGTALTSFTDELNYTKS